MPSRKRAAVFLAAVLAATSAFASPPAARQGPKPKYSRQAEFSIPFNMPALESHAPQPLEVQLHVSENRGVAWRLYASVAPDEKRFRFRAPGDGEYWFMVRTKYAMGVLRPAAPPAAELIVVVDTTAPTLELAAALGAGGEVLVRWSAADDNPRSDGLKVEYRAGEEGAPWRPVAVDPVATADAAGLCGGEFTFLPETAGPVTVRAEIHDLSGNRAVSQAPVAPGAGLAATAVAETAGGRAAVETIASPPPDEPAAPGGGPTIPTHWPTEPTGDSPLDPAEEVVPPSMGDGFPGQAGPPDSLLPEPVGTYPRTDAESTTEAELGPPADSALLESGAFEVEMPPQGVRPRWVNSRRFELEYEIEAVGPSGVAKVELWATRDGGTTWTRLGADDDGRSPMTVSVEGEGMYGFRMVVETGTGLRTAAPRPGDPPDVWVAVDLTQPTARLIAAEQGAGEQVGELVICWDAGDQLLSERPISLWFSETASGPWTAIAAGLENTGRYSWRLDHRVGDRVYLRLEVRDEAGNVRVVDTAEAISIEAVRPQGHIRNVRPLSDATRRSKLIYNLFR